MSLRRSSLVLVVALALSPACTLKLASMARDDGRDSMDCDDAQWKARPTGAEERKIIVYGCDRYEVYEGVCNGEKNRCDSATFSADCDGGCRVRRTESGDLVDGKIPPEVLKSEKE